MWTLPQIVKIQNGTKCNAIRKSPSGSIIIGSTPLRHEVATDVKQIPIRPIIINTIIIIMIVLRRLSFIKVCGATRSMLGRRMKYMENITTTNAVLFLYHALNDYNFGQFRKNNNETRTDFMSGNKSARSVIEHSCEQWFAWRRQKSSHQLINWPVSNWVGVSC